MGALPQARPESTLRKPPVSENLDKYGRNPNALPEQFRTRGEAWAPRPIAAEADLHRLSSGSVYYAFISIVNTLSLGRPHAPKEPWYDWTEPYSAQELAEYMYANVRDVQRKIAELESRGMIAVKTVKVGGVPKYSISLLYSKWRALEDYAVWKRRQIVAIDEALGEEVEDESPAVISKDAVRLTRKPQRIGPGRSSRAVAVNVGVSSFRFQSADSRLDLIHDTVVQSGCLIVSVASQKSEGKAKGEENKRDTHVADIPTHGGSPKGETPRQSNDNHKLQSAPAVHPRAAELVKLFDPILARSGSRLLSGDPDSLKAACLAVGDCDHDFLVHFAVQRAERPVKSPLHVKTICAEALASWKALDGAGRRKRDDAASPEEIAELIAKERAARLGRKR